MKKFLEKIIRSEIKDKDINFAAGILSVVFAIFAFVSTLATKQTFSSSVIGPKTVPQIFSGIVFVLGVYLIIRWSVRRARDKKSQPVTKKADTEEPVDKMMVFRKVTPLVSFLLLAMYIYLMRPIGFTFASIIYLTLQIPLLSADLSVKSFLKALLIAVIASALTYLLFVTGFSLKLPKGPLGF